MTTSVDSTHGSFTVLVAPSPTTAPFDSTHGSLALKEDVNVLERFKLIYANIKD